ncbi:MAG: SBBP repeat-containing protein, partial [Terriglobia bacterium]
AQGRLSPATGAEDSAATEVAAGFSPAIEKQNPCPAKAGLYGPAQPCVAAGPASLSTGVAAASAGNPKSAIQNRKYLDGRYVLRGNNQVGFEVASYDRRQPLIIDPVLMYSSLIGGDGGSVGAGVAVDGLGDVFLTGRAWDDFPQVNKIPGACQECGGSAVFVTKINAAGNALVYSSLIGGSSLQGAAGIAVDGSGSAYLTGVTQSTDFPRVHQIPGACNGKCGTGYPIENAFVTKISAAGNALVYSSYIGGSGYPPNGVPTGDAAYSIAVDGLANAYLTGTSDSPDFPIVNQIPGACNGLCGTVAGNVFVTKMNAAGSALLYSSRVGGSNNDIGYGVALDGSGNAYLTGSTGSTDFPRVHQIPGACNGTCGTASGKGDAFVTKINAAGSALVYSSYVGGGGTRYSIGDFGYGIAVDGSGNAYLTGETTSTDFPIVNQIPGACNGTCGSNKNPVIFATKVNAAGSALVYSSLIGGSGGPNDFGDRGYAIAVDGSGNAYLTGESFSHDFPRVKQVPGACNGTCGARFTSSAFVTEINAAGSALNNSSLIGGSGSSGAGGDAGTGVAVDAAGNVYLTGLTNSADFPRVNQIPGACSGGCGDGFGYAVFVLKIITPTTPFIVLAPTSLTFAPQGVQAPNFPQTVTLTNGGVLPLSITGITLTGLNAGDFTQANSCPLSPNTLGPNDYCAITVVFAPTGAGTLNADVTLADNAPGSPQNVPLTGVGVSGKPGLAGPRSRH